MRVQINSIPSQTQERRANHVLSVTVVQQDAARRGAVKGDV